MFARRLHAEGVRDVREVRREHIEAHQAALLEKNKPRTAAQRVQAVRRLFRHLADHGHLLLDPSEEVVALKHSSRIPRRLVSEAEMAKLLSAPKVSSRVGIRDRALLEMLYSTAMRVGELLQLEVSDVDLELGLVRIREGKGRKERVVPLGTTARHWVREYGERVRPWWMRGEEHERRLWVTNQGRPCRVGSVHHMLHVYSGRAGIRSVYPHAIRHAVAAHMLARGADLRAIQKLLGHASLETTQRYTKVVPLDVKGTHARTHPLEVERGSQP